MQRPEVLTQLTSDMCTDLVTSSWPKWALLSQSSYYNGFKISEISKQGTAGKITHINSRFLR